MDSKTRELVRKRAGGCCEYCGVSEQYFLQEFQVEHITPKCHRGSDDLSNLAFACQRCNLHKGPNIAGLDPDTDQLTRLFDPRSDLWAEHFKLLENGEIVARTDIGRTTIYVLAMNAKNRLKLRATLVRIKQEPNQ